jgi:hypothetical protein
MRARKKMVPTALVYIRHNNEGLRLLWALFWPSASTAAVAIKLFLFFSKEEPNAFRSCWHFGRGVLLTGGGIGPFAYL